MVPFAPCVGVCNWTNRLLVRANDGMDPASTDVRGILHEINSNWSNDDVIVSALRNLGDLAQSSRCSAGLLLRPGVDTFIRLAVRPTSRAIRTSSLNFLIETAKAFPSFVVPRLVPVVARCLQATGNKSGDAAVVETTMKIVPDLIALSPESADEILARGLFPLAVDGSKEAEKTICKALGSLFLLKGASVDPSSGSSDRYVDGF